MKLRYWGLVLSAGLYLALIFPLSDHLQHRPVQIKLGALPDAEILRLASADQRYAVADWTILKVLFYFGRLIEKSPEDQLFHSDPDYPGMLQALKTAVQLDPYNMDAYYFVQAVFPWEGATQDANELLDYGMSYRTWDFYLPFFASFNAAYFQHDYKAAARYMQQAADLSGIPSFARLSSRYMLESGQADLAIAYLDVMIAAAKDPLEKRLYETRREAISTIRELQRAVTRYRDTFGETPADLHQLVLRGVLPEIPPDPYGGEFYLDASGKVASTSKMAFPAEADRERLPQ